jgi:hypothetical protein
MKEWTLAHKHKLDEIYAVLQERYKDEPLLRIYRGKEANRLSREQMGDGIIDEEFEDQVLFICSDMEGKGGEYLEGSYYLEIDEDLKPQLIWCPFPVEGVPMGMEDILKELDEFKDDITHQ